ncbi:GMC family oxidoreductase [Ottowia thiooxydans]|uniref:5-(Hydroxymethyl)furfural/furfural oxidase n=1 Tax=Ottowia thiooxydans TaxID=219182 RepID=A0ABV2QCA7_9BURK
MNAAPSVGIADGATFDVVIVGGGSAGCVLASRLSEDPSTSVLLIEAGEDMPPGQVDPDILSSFPLATFRGDRWLWPGLRVRPAAGRASVPYEQGRVLGGGSTVNAQAANRGLPRDYDDWCASGLVGWGWDDVLPYFRKLERDLDFGGPLHGDAGPVPVRRIPPAQWNGFSLALRKAYLNAGFEELHDQNGEFGDGFFSPAISNEDDHRVTAAMAYLDANVRRRKNLQILTGHRVDRIAFDDRVATSVQVSFEARPVFSVRGRRFVLTAGALHTPALLLRSGVGPAEELLPLGAQMVANVPAIGRRLQDHPGIALCQYLPRGLRAPAPPVRASLLGLRYSSGFDAGEDSDMYVASSGRAAWHAMGARLATYFLWCNRPYARGQVRLASMDPNVAPEVDLNLLGDERDAMRMADGVHRLAGIAQSMPFAHLEGAMPLALSPRAKALSRITPSNAALARVAATVVDAAGRLRPLLLRHAVNGGWSIRELLTCSETMQKFLRAQTFSMWHVSGTCKMGHPDSPDTVADAHGKVVALANVWVADASVIPTLPSANTNLPVLMVAEKISDGLRKMATS